MNNPFFSIIIPTLNEEVNLPILLKSLSEQTEKDFEVIVSDSGSKDATRERTMEFSSRISDFQFVEHQSKNVSAARNFGATRAKGDFFVFFDADVEPEKDFFEKIKKLIIKNNLDAATVWNRDKTREFSGQLMLGLLNISMTLFQKIKPSANGPCILIKKSLFEKIHGFDDTIIFGEDFDLMQRAGRKGMKFKVFRKPVLFVSPRRFEQEGFILSLYKSIRALIHQLFIGPIRKPIFKYEMGGQNFEEVENVKSQNAK